MFCMTLNKVYDFEHIFEKFMENPDYIEVKQTS